VSDESLGPLEVSRKSGDEQFVVEGRPAGFDLLEFWRWSASDLVDNTARGVLAEFVVAKALGIDVTSPRVGWATWDLDWEVSPGVTLAIEVKSAAYVQSWGQKALSAIQFVVPRRRGFDAVKNALEETAARHAHVYVFALLANTDKRTIDPMRLEQWRFYCLATKQLDARTRSQHSVTLKSLEALAGDAVDFEGLTCAVRRAGFEQLGVSG
jgi:hypothetical protein